MNPIDAFADFADDLAEVYAPAPATAPLGERPTAHDIRASAPAQTFREPCGKCAGTGAVTIGYTFVRKAKCFACEGRGYHERKTSPEARAKAAQKREEKREEKRVERQQQANAWREQHPDVCKWLQAKDGVFDFATSLVDQLGARGSLSEGQVAAVRRCIARDAERAEQRVQREASAPTIDTTALEAAFAKAREAGAKKTILRFAGFAVKPAPLTGRNPGALYVTREGEYIGKIAQGRFVATRECPQDVAQEVLTAAADPKAAAIAYGRRTGCCSVCGRELTDPTSVEAGIGPICAGKFGW
jgi:hypothetical protein